MRNKKRFTISAIVHNVRVVLGTVALTLIFFLILPFMQTINKPLTSNLMLQSVDTVNVPPPPPPPQEEPEEEPEQEEVKPEFVEDMQPLNLSQLELALNNGISDGLFGGDFAVKLNTVVSPTDNVESLFSMADLDQRPRIIYQPSPVLNAKVRKKAPGTVYIIFIVDESGRVVKPVIQRSSDPVFEKPALAAVRRWKFEPGKRNGKSVRFRMRVPITFPKG